MEKKYYLSYKNIEPKNIELVRSLIKGGYYKKDVEGKREDIIKLVESFCEYYDIEVPEILFNKPTPCYDTICNEIHLSNESIVSLLHEFKHCLQHIKQLKNTEDIARGWSLSLFYRASKNNFTKLAKEDKILFVDKNDFK